MIVCCGLGMGWVSFFIGCSMDRFEPGLKWGSSSGEAWSRNVLDSEVELGVLF